MGLKSPTGRLARWALQLQAYNIKTVYTPGKTNEVADSLSRPICTEADDSICGICTATVEIPIKSVETMRSEQMEDPEVMKTIRPFEETPSPPELKQYIDKGYIMANRVLYRYSPDSESEEAQYVVPAQCRQNIMA